MRNKIKQLMNKEEGFTLVELLAVIVILGLIIAIAIPSIGNVMTKANTNTEDANTVMIEDAARLWSIENPDEDSVEISTLITAGFLEERNNENLPGSVEKTDEGWTYNPSSGGDED